MSISIKQIHSVLSTYNKQLKLASFNRNKKNIIHQSKKHNATTSVEAKRKQIYQQAVSNIVNKLTNNDTLRSVFVKYKQKN